MKKTEQKKQWHMGFYGAIELEFRDDKEVLDFHREYQLSKKPLSMDMLVVKKNCDKALHNDIGKIFKGHNIIEYKSPKDMLGIDQFYKGLSYACLYKSLGKYADEIKIEEVTLSFVRESYPRELFKRLQELEHNVTRKYPGVYYVSNKLMIPIQIIVTKELELEEHISLRMLSDNVTEQNAKRITTGMLNQVINEAIALVQPPSDKGKKLKIYYGTQVATKPPTFIIFVNKKELFHFSYERYLVNQIRKEFGLE